MMKILRAAVVMLLLAMAFSGFVRSQDFPSLKQVVIHANVRLSDTDHFYYYSYTLKNDSLNTGSIQEFEVDISRLPRTIDLDTVGLKFGGDGFLERSFRRHFPSLKGGTIPVGFYSKPGVTWIAGLSDDLTASYAADSLFILPNATVEGIEIMSKGMPSIRRCIVSPYFDFDSLFSEQRFPNEEDIPDVDSIRDNGRYYGWTVGPTSLPVNFNPTDFIDSIRVGVMRSYQLGWIAGQETSDKYTSSLESARTHLLNKDMSTTRSILEGILVSCRADSGGGLSSEAFALIYFNAQYFLSQLRDE